MWLSRQNNLTNLALSQLNTSLNHCIPCHLQQVTKYVKPNVTIISCDKVFHHQPENVRRLVQFYIPLHQAQLVRLLRVLQNHGQLWQIVVSCVFSVGKNWADYSIVLIRISPKATYFSLLVQSKVGKRKHTPIKSLILILFQFSLQKFSNSLRSNKRKFLKN